MLFTISVKSDVFLLIDYSIFDLLIQLLCKFESHDMLNSWFAAEYSFEIIVKLHKRK